MKKNRVKSILFPLLAALIWGTAFVSQRVSAGIIGAFAFNGARCTVAFAALGAVIAFTRRVTKEPGPPKDKRKLLVGGIACGVMLAFASNLQQIGLADTQAGKAGFLTSLYIVIVPLLGVFLRKRIPASLWVSVAAAAGGLYLLSVTGTFTLSKGDPYILLCALFFAVHILLIDRFSGQVNALELSCVQFAVAAALSWGAAFLFEPFTLAQLRQCVWDVLYVGVFSSAVAYTLQIAAQKEANPVALSLLLSLESVFSVLAGAFFLGEKFTGREVVGCAAVLFAVVMAQVPEGFFSGRRAERAAAQTGR